VLVVLVLIAALVTAVGIWLHNGPFAAFGRIAEPPPEFTIPFLDVASGSAVPTAPALPGPTETTAHWIAAVSAHTDIPSRALQAYLAAADRTAVRTPACHLTWATLAGVGRIESDHGQHHGDQIGPDGVEATPIIGPALDGSPGVQRIADTDQGLLDDDPVWDHAVGPMQFLPSRWHTLGQRASGDGRPADPQNIDDAALTAARYLCSYGGDLAVPARWWAVVFHYNNSVTYGRQVFSAADAYAKASLPPPVTPTSATR
jgi:membrane-bound lytic murein transglycosylase B